MSQNHKWHELVKRGKNGWLSQVAHQDPTEVEQQSCQLHSDFFQLLSIVWSYCSASPIETLNRYLKGKQYNSLHSGILYI